MDGLGARWVVWEGPWLVRHKLFYWPSLAQAHIHRRCEADYFSG